MCVSVHGMRKRNQVMADGSRCYARASLTDNKTADYYKCRGVSI